MHGWLRSVANIYHAFARCSRSANELAYAANCDPGRLLCFALIGSGYVIDGKPTSRQAKISLWMTAGDLGHVAQPGEAMELIGAKGKSGNGWGMGIAVHRSFLTYVASVVEVEVDSPGACRILNVYTAVDAGIVANPDMVISQFQGAAVFGTTHARTGEITATTFLP